MRHLVGTLVFFLAIAVTTNPALKAAPNAKELAKLLNSPDYKIRNKASDDLRKLGPRVVSEVLPVLQKGSDDARFSAACCVRKLFPPPGFDYAKKTWPTIKNTPLTKYEKLAYPALLAAQKDKNLLVRSVALHALERLFARQGVDNKLAIPIIVNALNEMATRRQAVICLSRLDSIPEEFRKRISDSLKEQLAKPAKRYHEMSRPRCRELASKLGDAEKVSVLVALIVVKTKRGKLTTYNAGFALKMLAEMGKKAKENLTPDESKQLVAAIANRLRVTERTVTRKTFQVMIRFPKKGSFQIMPRYGWEVLRILDPKVASEFFVEE